MRARCYSGRLISCVVAIVSASVLIAFSGGVGASVAACTSAKPECGEWVNIAGGPNRTFVYRNHALEVKNERITRALIMVHGQGRNADGYFMSAMAAAFLANAIDDTIVIAPRFTSNEGATCRDKVALQELNWVCSGPESWRNGGAAVGHAEITSYHVADEILTRLARKALFPNLSSVVLAGHSAGGQYTTRYAMSNQIHERLGVRLTYLVANPSSYTYPDGLRPTRVAFPADVAALPPGYTPPLLSKPTEAFQRFADAEGCTAYDQWPYGLQNRKGYSSKFSSEQLVKQLAARPTTFLVGELDILPLYGFDGSCSAMAQGPTRLARGLAYSRYLNDKLGAKHRARVIPACGHSARCMFTSNQALPLLFPAPE